MLALIPLSSAPTRPLTPFFTAQKIMTEARGELDLRIRTAPFAATAGKRMKGNRGKISCSARGVSPLGVAPCPVELSQLKEVVPKGGTFREAHCPTPQIITILIFGSPTVSERLAALRPYLAVGLPFRMSPKGHLGCGENF